MGLPQESMLYVPTWAEVSPRCIKPQTLEHKLLPWSCLFLKNAIDWDLKCPAIFWKASGHFSTILPSHPAIPESWNNLATEPILHNPSSQLMKTKELFLFLVQSLQIFQSEKELTQPTVHIIYSEVVQKQVPDVTKTNPNKYREHQL